MNPEILSALIGAGVAVLGCLWREAIADGRRDQRLDEHDKRFLGVDKVFGELDTRFVPRLEIDARLRAVSESQERIEKLLNLVLPTVYRERRGEN